MLEEGHSKDYDKDFGDQEICKESLVDWIVNMVVGEGMIMVELD